MSRNQIIGRLEKLEQRQSALSYNGVDRFIWKGPKDDAALAEAEWRAEVSGRLLIVRTIVDPPTKKSPGIVIRDDCGRARCISLMLPFVKN